MQTNVAQRHSTPSVMKADTTPLWAIRREMG